MPETVPGVRTAAAEQRRNVVKLRRQRLSFEEIGSRLGFTRQRAFQIYERALREIPAAEVSQHRAEELALYDDAVRDLLLIARDHRMPRTAVEAWRAILGFCERRAKLLGLDEPQRSAAQVTIDSTVEADIERMLAELLAMSVVAAEVLPDAAPGLPPGHRGPSRSLSAGQPANR